VKRKRNTSIGKECQRSGNKESTQKKKADKEIDSETKNFRLRRCRREDYHLFPAVQRFTD